MDFWITTSSSITNSLLRKAALIRMSASTAAIIITIVIFFFLKIVVYKICYVTVWLSCKRRSFLLRVSALIKMIREHPEEKGQQYGQPKFCGFSGRNKAVDRPGQVKK